VIADGASDAVAIFFELDGEPYFGVDGAFLGFELECGGDGGDDVPKGLSEGIFSGGDGGCFIEVIDAHEAFSFAGEEFEVFGDGDADESFFGFDIEWPWDIEGESFG
jgi:hypothetical protein